MNKHLPSFTTGTIDPDVKHRLKHLVSSHVDSFNYFLEYGIHDALQNIIPMEVECSSNKDGIEKVDSYIKMEYTSISVGKPLRKKDVTLNAMITPREARESRVNYSGPISVNVQIEVNGESMTITVKLGELPTMVMSEKCHLKGTNSKQLAAMKEEVNEVGGYFIVNGIERVIRLLQVPRRNYASAIERSSYKNRGPSYSDKGIAMRCVRKDQTSVTLTLHYLTNGGATLKFVLRKQEFLIPVVLVAKSLMDISDKELYNRVIEYNHSNTFMTTRLELLLRDFKSYNLHTKSQCQAYLGSLFRGFLPITTKTTDQQAGALLIRQYLFVHVDSFPDKLECLLHMIRKLFAFAENKCLPDNPDALMSHELLLPGHLINMIIKEKLDDLLLQVRQTITRDYRMNPMKFLTESKSTKYFSKQFDRYGLTLGNKIGTFLSTGNIVSSTGLDLMQVSGYTIVAERLNAFRYYSHFQSVHRGQFFTTMKTTTVRKLLPESWGFLCPVHTPDGGPCGLLNHLAKDCIVVSYPTTKKFPFAPTTKLSIQSPLRVQDINGDSMVDNQRRLSHSNQLTMDVVNSRRYVKELLVSLGMVPSGLGSGDGQLISNSMFLPVLYDGIVLGSVHHDKAFSIVSQMRMLKTMTSLPYDKRNRNEDILYDPFIIQLLQTKKKFVDPTMELAYFPKADVIGPYPGIYIFTEPGRLIRPVIQRYTNAIEWIGPMEQIYLDIACIAEDIRDETTHLELSPTSILSHIAALTPFSDYNQSPRNMYQCQMGKQTMGTPAHAIRYRSDNKLYRIQNTQVPIVQTEAHQDFMMDEYPQGCNAIVAVISYTGYDMEDAMIISKSSFERGFGHGSMYKTTIVDLDEEEKRLTRKGVKPNLKFSNVPLEGIKEPSQFLSKDSCNLITIGEIKGEKEVNKFCDHLDIDGLPFEGHHIQYEDAVCCFVDTNTNEHHTIKHKENEAAYVDVVRIIGTGSTEVNNLTTSSTKNKKAHLRKVSITLRYRRNPVIGDKFSSRHGQKGTLSFLWPQENMPFTESGMCPDVLINPHAFPSRMTIGMLIESMAGKAGSMYGVFHDATPFQFHEERKVIDYLGEQLRECGYAYHGSEPLYNGMTGNLMQADIFIGVVFYQRLRHMVSDKSQVRSTGPVMAITRQPVKGRKKHGGIRLGEMERDALLSHGAAYCLHDRLMNCSDSHVAHVCSTCGSLLTVYAQSPGQSSYSSSTISGPAFRNKKATKQFCSYCKSSRGVRPIYLPYVFRYLTNELAGMGIKLALKLSN